MRAILKLKNGKGLFYKENYEEPTPKAGEVKVKIAYAYPDGSDLHTYMWDGGQHPDAANVPFVMGHEGSGKIVELGAGVTGWQIGDRVSFDSHIPGSTDFFGINYPEAGLENIDPAKKIIGIGADGLFADYATFPASILRKIPDSILLKIAAMFEPAAIGVRAVLEAERYMKGNPLFEELRKQGIKPRVFVFGSTGVMGAVTSAVLAQHGYEVIAVGRTPAKLDVLKQLHPDIKTILNTEVDTFIEKTGPAHVVIEVSGNTQVLSQMLGDVSLSKPHIMPHGIWVQLGLFKGPNMDVTDIASLKKGIKESDIFRRFTNAAVRTEIKIVGVVGRTKPEWDEIIRLVASGSIDLKPLISNEFTLEEVEKAITSKGMKNLIVIDSDLK